MINKNSLSYPIILYSVFLIIIPLINSNIFIDHVSLPKILAYAIFLFLLSIGLFSKVIIEGDKKIIAFIILIGLYISISFFSVWQTDNHGEALWLWIKNSSQILLIIPGYFALRKFNQNDVRQYFSMAIAIANMIVIIIGVSQFAGNIFFEDFSHQLTYRFTSTFGHRNLFSHFLVLCIPFLMLGFISFKRNIKYIFPALIVINSTIVFLLLTKTAWLALFLSLLQTVLLLFFIYRKTHTKKAISIVVMFVLFTVISGLFIYNTSNEAIKKQFEVLKNYQYGSSLERIYLWKKTINSVQDQLIFGHGQGKWRINIPAQGTSKMRSASGTVHFQRPHNDFIWILYEQGILALICYLSIFILLYWYGIEQLVKEAELKKKYFLLAFLFSLTVFSIISFFSFPMERISHPFYFYTIIILFLIFISDHKKSQKGAGRNYLRIMVVAGLMGFSLSLITIAVIRSKSEIITLKLLESRQLKKWSDVVKYAESAENYFYKIDPSATPLSWYSGSAFYFMGEKEKAHEKFLEAYKLHPNHVHVLNNLATTFVIKGNNERAIELYKKCIQIAPLFEDPYYNLSSVYFSQEKYNIAFKELMKIPIEITGKDEIKFNGYLFQITKGKIAQLKEIVEEPIIIEKLNGLLELDSWVQLIVEHTLESQEAVGNQIILEVLYGLEVLDQQISSDESLRLFEKYKE